MSTPLFIRDIIAETGGHDGITGSDPLAFNTSTGDADNLIVDTVTEQTLIEEILWCADVYSTDAGQLVVYLHQAGSSFWTRIGAYPIPAGTSTVFASGRISINLPLAPWIADSALGARLAVVHTVKKSASYVVLRVTAIGGVLG